VAALALVAVLATRPPATSSAADSPLLGQPAPAISAPGLTGGNVVLSRMRGHFVLVNFFASWCQPCHQEQGSLLQLSRSLTVLGVVYDDSASSALGFLVSSGAHWPAVADPSGAISVAYGVRGPPESYLVSPDGTVVAKIVGAIGAAQVHYLDSVMARVLRTGQ
jgi:cytochrome c biogenesis protein CcmG/thiol:disulfide interchange protein DsbE